MCAPARSGDAGLALGPTPWRQGALIAGSDLSLALLCAGCKVYTAGAAFLCEHAGSGGLMVDCALWQTLTVEAQATLQAISAQLD